MHKIPPFAAPSPPEIAVASPTPADETEASPSLSSPSGRKSSDHHYRAPVSAVEHDMVGTEAGRDGDVGRNCENGSTDDRKQSKNLFTSVPAESSTVADISAWNKASDQGSSFDAQIGNKNDSALSAAPPGFTGGGVSLEKDVAISLVFMSTAGSGRMSYYSWYG